MGCRYSVRTCIDVDGYVLIGKYTYYNVRSTQICNELFQTKHFTNISFLLFQLALCTVDSVQTGQTWRNIMSVEF